MASWGIFPHPLSAGVYKRVMYTYGVRFFIRKTLLTIIYRHCYMISKSIIIFLIFHEENFYTKKSIKILYFYIFHYIFYHKLFKPFTFFNATTYIFLFQRWIFSQWIYYIKMSFESIVINNLFTILTSRHFFVSKKIITQPIWCVLLL